MPRVVDPVVPTDTRPDAILAGWPDYRIWVPWTAGSLSVDNYPQNAAIKLDPIAVDSPCSAASIGHYTAMTASHCVWTSSAATPPPNFDPPGGLSKGTLQRRFKFTQGSPSGGSGTSDTSTYSYWLPVAATYSSTKPQWDWAVLDFFVSTHKPVSFGYAIPAWTNDTNDYLETPSFLAGHDTQAPHPANPQRGVTYVGGSMIYRFGWTGNLYFHPTDATRLIHHMATTAGSSGSGVEARIFLQPQHGMVEYPFWTGIHVSGDPTHNYAMRLNSTMWTFVEDYSTEY